VKVNRLVAQFLPFRGTRYDAGALGPDGIAAVVAPPYDVIDDDERERLLRRAPHNSVRLILPGGDESQRYAAAAGDYATWQRDGVLRRDDAARFYVYRMTFIDEDGRARHTLGVLGALSLPGTSDDGEPILPHERTLPKAKSDRLALLRATRANFDPIWGLSLADGLSELLAVDGDPAVVCHDDDGVEHALWPVADGERAAAITRAVASRPVVLADGHHRFETAIAYRDELRARGEEPGPADAGSIMTLVVELADEQLDVRPIDRLVHDLPAGTRLRDALVGAFVVTDAGPNTPDGVDALRRRMRDAHGLGVVDRDGLALAVPDPARVEQALASLPEPVRAVDSAVFEHLVVPALDGAHVAYRHDAREVAALVEKAAADAAVLLRPADVPTIRAVAFAHERMPQKTTFFHPKPRTGFVFRSPD
jgi:uncharacterized protein (DUF1015 family)